MIFKNEKDVLEMKTTNATCGKVFYANGVKDAGLLTIGGITISPISAGADLEQFHKYCKEKFENICDIKEVIIEGNDVHTILGMPWAVETESDVEVLADAYDVQMKELDIDVKCEYRFHFA